jgi:hypothetical protein
MNYPILFLFIHNASHLRGVVCNKFKFQQSIICSRKFCFAELSSIYNHKETLLVEL